MAQLIINVPDAQVTRVLNALCDAWEYEQRKLVDETQQQFVRRMITDRLRRQVLRQEADAAAQAVLEGAEDPLTE